MFQFIQMTILGRLLKTSDFGLMGMVTVVMGFAIAFADMGISNAIIHKQDISKRHLSGLFWVNIISGVLVFVIVFLCAPLVALFYDESSLTFLVRVAAIIFPVTSLGQQFQILMQKELKFKQLSLIETVSFVIGIVASVILAFLGVGVLSLIIGHFANAFSKTAILSYYGFKNWKPEFIIEIKELREYINFGLYQLGDKTINYFNSNIDYIIIGFFLGKEELGLYTFAFQLIILPINKINPIILRVAFPVFSKVQNDIDYLKKGYMKIIESLCTINTPIFIGMIATAPLFVPVIFGSKWEPSVVIIQILAGVGLMRSIGNPVGALLLAKGRADLGFKWSAMVMLTQLPGIFIGLKMGNVIGVAIAFLILQFIYSAFNYFYVIRKLLGRCLKEYLLCMTFPLISSIIMYVLLLFYNISIKINNEFLDLLLQVVLGAIVYCLLYYKFNYKKIVEVKKMIVSR